MVRKDISVGEYDLVTGLTHITHQHGRMLFNMGASAKKNRRGEPDAISVAVKQTPTLSTGTFTGLSLYPEEAHYLMQRDALVIHLRTFEDHDARELSFAEFTAILATDTRVSFACLEVYTYLKDQKLHPRRCLNPLPTSTNSEDGRSIPRHINEVEACDLAFDVWKTAAVDDLPQAATFSVNGATKGNKLKQKQTKKLMLIFRVAIYCHWDTAPSPRSFRQVISRSKARDCSLMYHQIPVKVAVVQHDQSVLLFEISF